MTRTMQWWCGFLCWLMDQIPNTGGFIAVRTFRAVVWVAEHTTPADY